MRSLTWFLAGTPIAIIAATWWIRSRRRRRELQGATRTRQAVQRETETGRIAGTSSHHRSEVPFPAVVMPNLSPRAPERGGPEEVERPNQVLNDTSEAITETGDGSHNSVTTSAIVDSGSSPSPLASSVDRSPALAEIIEAVSGQSSPPDVRQCDAPSAHIDAASPQGERGEWSGDPQAMTSDAGQEVRSAICPRCGVACAPEDEERVFGFRVMRSTNARGEQVSVVRRQSYCRRCRAEHAGEMRERRALDDQERVGPAPSTVTPAADAGHEVEGAAATADTESARELTDVDVKALEFASVQTATEPVGVQDDDGDGPEDQGSDYSPPATPASDRPRTGRQYRAPSAGRPSSGVVAGKSKIKTEASNSRNGNATFDLRVLFDRHEGCSISLLPRRPAGWPEAVKISTAADSFELDPLQEGWYEEIQPNDMGGVLRQGVVGVDLDQGREWQLTGREVFTLAGRSGLRGFVSCPRLEIGRDHVVLCHSPRVQDIEAALHEAGCSGWTRLLGEGVPSEWTLLRHVVPSRAVAQNEASNILNILKPVPEIDIELEGGIRVDHNNWLLGCHPTIRIYGAQDHLQDVVIDGQTATFDASGGFSVPGMTELGDHQISYSGITKRFSIVNRPLPSRLWSAYRFDSGSDREAFTVCGPFVQHVAPAPQSGNDEESISAVRVVPISHRVLIGANPGEIQVAPVRPGPTRMSCITCVPFEPVWGLPLSPLLADKRRASVRFLAATLLLAGPSKMPVRVPRDRSAAIHQWCSYLLDASRKGLELEPQSSEVAALWRRYRDRAREVQRRLK
jgi:hypothetical protein